MAAPGETTLLPLTYPVHRTDMGTTDKSQDVAVQLPAADDLHVVDPRPRVCSSRAQLWPVLKVLVSLVAHAAFISCIVVVAWSRSAVAAADGDEENGRRLYRYYLIASSLAGVFYIVMMVEAADCTTYRQLRSFRADLPAQEYINRIRSETPRLAWFAHSYHYELRGHTKLGRNAKGEVNIRQVASRHKERIITHRETEVVKFKECRDITQNVTNVKPASVIRIECSKAFTFKDNYSRVVYHQRYTAFKQRSRGRDELMDDGVTLELAGYQSALTAGGRPGPAPWWMSEVWFWVLTMLLLTWPHRWLFCLLTPKVTITFIKQLEF